ncbi:ABC transporter substrate-binding protein [Chitinophagaceae bacterium LB-8]|uniref:ABC transporter substrate-binding protein n=1 Tax=Paraflavisolibacter caeni TaxID=2982496 RepID=A0A9X2XNB0_9BACT|nr:ABC transporter substrate-binding protein [Paraflavisolibacter caeni]MCU7548368.1 ABC transporter substrate-binding protein [Paraflavisolibacter caeni]
MKQRLFYLGLLIIVLVHSVNVQAQSLQPARHKIAFFAPLYLDSVFDASYNYRFGKEFPKFLHSGLEFYQGAQLALDSLQRAGAPLEVFIYDSKSKRYPLAQQLNDPAMNGVELMIAHANPGEVRMLAETALQRKVPLISATLPNDAGVQNNPYLVILNSTLRAHCEGIYQYLQKNHRQDKTILFRKNGVQENQLRDYFSDIAKSTTSSPLKIDVVDAGTITNTSALVQKLDSTKRNVVIAGSLDIGFGTELSRQLAAIGETYPITLIGMPTWEEIKEFSKPEYKSIEIIYTSPFSYNRTNRLMTQISNEFVSKIDSRPTDMFFRGYETMLRFALLLLDTKKDIASNLSRKGNYIFTQFDIQPVFINKQNMTLDYFENKKLYFIKINNGIKSVVE